MNKFIKLPLFLGFTCLIAGGLLTGVVSLTDPIIEANRIEKMSRAFKEMYEDDSSIIEQEIIINDNDYLSKLNIVNHSEEISYVYLCQSFSKFETFTFYVGISLEKSSVDGFYLLETSKPSVGYDKFNDNFVVSSKYDGYLGDATIVIGGASYTSRAVKDSIDSALDDFNRRVN